MPIKDSLTNKNALQRAEIKATEIAKIGSVAKTRTGDFHIEIVSISKIQSDLGTPGIELLVKAWDKNNNQIGFGRDGSVEIERFRIFNPPIMIPDGTKRIVEDDDGKGGTKEYEIDNFKEDLEGALIKSLEHTLKVKKQKFNNTRIVRGRIGSTTTTVYPDAHTESTSVDGIARQLIPGAGTTWSTLVAGAGTNASDADVTRWSVYIAASGTTNQWSIIRRGFFLFDTSGIDDGDSVDSAIFSLYGTDKSDNLGVTPDINVYSSAPASNTAIVAGDYDSIGSTEFSTAITYANWSTSAYNDFTLNASGEAAIDFEGITKLGARNANYDAADNAPSWADSGSCELKHYMAEQSGTTNDPKLVIEHSAGGGGGATGFMTTNTGHWGT